MSHSEQLHCHQY